MNIKDTNSKNIGYKGKYYDPNYKRNKKKYGDKYNPRDFACPSSNSELKKNDVRKTNINTEEKSIVIQNSHMGYSLAIRFGYEKDRVQYREEEEAGFSWVGDQLVPNEYAGAYSEQAIIYGELMEKTIIYVRILDSRMGFDEYDILEFSTTDDLKDDKLEQFVIKKMEPYVLNMLCAIIASDKSNEDNVASEYLKVATSAGLKVGNSVMPHYDIVMEVYEMSSKFDEYRKGNKYKFTNLY